MSVEGGGGDTSIEMPSRFRIIVKPSLLDICVYFCSKNLWKFFLYENSMFLSFFCFVVFARLTSMLCFGLFMLCGVDVLDYCCCLSLEVDYLQILVVKGTVQRDG